MNQQEAFTEYGRLEIEKSEISTQITELRERLDDLIAEKAKLVERQTELMELAKAP